MMSWPYSRRSSVLCPALQEKGGPSVPFPDRSRSATPRYGPDVMARRVVDETRGTIRQGRYGHGRARDQRVDSRGPTRTTLTPSRHSDDGGRRAHGADGSETPGRRRRGRGPAEDL